MEQPKSGGMSKGCLIGLIVAGGLLVLVIILMVTCYLNRDDLAKFVSDQSVTRMKTEIGTMAGPGVDSAKFNALADAFSAKLKTEPFDEVRFAGFVTAVQNYPKMAEDKVLDSTEVMELAHAMITYFPDLSSYWTPSQPVDTTAATPDSAEGGVSDTVAKDTVTGQ